MRCNVTGMKDGTFHTAVGAVLIALFVVVLVATEGKAFVGALILGIIGIAVLLYGIRLKMRTQKRSDEPL